MVIFYSIGSVPLFRRPPVLLKKGPNNLDFVIFFFDFILKSKLFGNSFFYLFSTVNLFGAPFQGQGQSVLKIFNVFF